MAWASLICVMQSYLVMVKATTGTYISHFDMNQYHFAKYKYHTAYIWFVYVYICIYLPIYIIYKQINIYPYSCFLYQYHTAVDIPMHSTWPDQAALIAFSLAAENVVRGGDDRWIYGSNGVDGCLCVDVLNVDRIIQMFWNTF